MSLGTLCINFVCDTYQLSVAENLAGGGKWKLCAATWIAKHILPQGEATGPSLQ